MVVIPIRSASGTYFLKMGNHSIYGGGGVFYIFLKSTYCLTLLWFSVVTVLCDFLCNVMRKVQQKQWQIFVGKVLGKLIRLGNQRVTIDPLFPFNSSIDITL